MNYYCYVFESSYRLNSVFLHLEEAKIGFGALSEAVRTAETKPVMQQSLHYLTLALQRRKFNREAHTENDASLLVFVPPAKRSAPGSVWQTSRAPLESGADRRTAGGGGAPRDAAVFRTYTPRGVRSTPSALSGMSGESTVHNLHGQKRVAVTLLSQSSARAARCCCWWSWHRSPTCNGRKRTNQGKVETTVASLKSTNNGVLSSF